VVDAQRVHGDEHGHGGQRDREHARDHDGGRISKPWPSDQAINGAHTGLQGIVRRRS
jgi:hypothetical protein